MKKILAWIRDPNRNYQEGLLIYHKHKLNTKHDVFFNTGKPELIHMNMLLSKVTRIYHKLSVEPNIQKEEAPEPIKIKKIELIQKKEEAPKEPPVKLRKSKQYVNKLLTLNFNELSFDDQAIFYNSEKYFLDKKSLMLENGDIAKNMVSIHAKVKAINTDPKNDSKRAKLMKELAEMDETKAENWKVIDTWDEPDAPVDPAQLSAEKAVQLALKNEKKIKANKIYIYRAQKAVDAMTDPKTDKEKKKKVAKIREIEKRKKELENLDQPYTQK